MNYSTLQFAPSASGPRAVRSHVWDGGRIISRKNRKRNIGPDVWFLNIISEYGTIFDVISTLSAHIMPQNHLYGQICLFRFFRHRTIAKQWNPSKSLSNTRWLTSMLHHWGSRAPRMGWTLIRDKRLGGQFIVVKQGPYILGKGLIPIRTDFASRGTTGASKGFPLSCIKIIFNIWDIKWRLRHAKQDTTEWFVVAIKNVEENRA